MLGKQPAEGLKPDGPEIEEEFEIQRPGVGRIVHLSLAPNGTEEIRPCIIVRMNEFGDGPSDWDAIAQVFLCPGDVPYSHTSRVWRDDTGHFYVSIQHRHHGDGVGQWHWPLRT